MTQFVIVVVRRHGLSVRRTRHEGAMSSSISCETCRWIRARTGRFAWECVQKRSECIKNDVAGEVECLQLLIMSRVTRDYERKSSSRGVLHFRWAGSALANTYNCNCLSPTRKQASTEQEQRRNAGKSLPSDKLVHTLISIYWFDHSQVGGLPDACHTTGTLTDTQAGEGMHLLRPPLPVHRRLPPSTAPAGFAECSPSGRQGVCRCTSLCIVFRVWCAGTVVKVTSTRDPPIPHVSSLYMCRTNAQLLRVKPFCALLCFVQIAVRYRIVSISREVSVLVRASPMPQDSTLGSGWCLAASHEPVYGLSSTFLAVAYFTTVLATLRFLTCGHFRSYVFPIEA